MLRRCNYCWQVLVVKVDERVADGSQCKFARREFFGFCSSAAGDSCDRFVLLSVFSLLFRIVSLAEC